MMQSNFELEPKIEDIMSDPMMKFMMSCDGVRKEDMSRMINEVSSSVNSAEYQKRRAAMRERAARIAERNNANDISTKQAYSRLLDI